MRRFVTVCAGFLVAIMIVACVVTVLKIDLAPVKEKGKPPVRTQQLAQGVKLSRHGLYGINLVNIGRAHMRKLRKGPFTIGAINELVLEDVSLVLPEEIWMDEEELAKRKKVEVKKRKGETGPKVLLSKLGVESGHLKIGDAMPRFSSLVMTNLRVARLDVSNAVPWFAATRAKAVRNGLELYDGASFENGVTNAWSEALLVVDPKLALFPAR